MESADYIQSIFRESRLYADVLNTFREENNQTFESLHEKVKPVTNSALMDTLKIFETNYHILEKKLMPESIGSTYHDGLLAEYKIREEYVPQLALLPILIE